VVSHNCNTVFSKLWTVDIQPYEKCTESGYWPVDFHFKGYDAYFKYIKF